MRVIGNKTLDEQDRLKQEGEVDLEKVDDNSIAAYIMGCWEKAKTFKEQGAEQQILANMRQIDGEYDPKKLAAIKKIGGSEVFMMITDAKCKNARDWCNDIIFQASERPFSIQPTPVPELPDDIKSELFNRLFQKMIEMIAQQNPQILTDKNAMQQILESAYPEMEDKLREDIVREAKKSAEVVTTAVDDKLVEGGWYDALRETVKNTVLHTGILKGPVLKKRYTHKIKTDQDTGKLTSKTVEEIIPTYESRHPLYIYPAPGSTDVNDGYLIDRIKVTPLKLQELIGVPGYDEQEILEILKEAGEGGLRNWLNLQVDQDISDLNNEITTLAFDSDKIDCLEFWGYVYGDKIIEWGINNGMDGKPLDENTYYNICAYLIGNHVIKIQFNRDPLGRKPFYRASFEEREGSFWGKGLPEIISDCQQTCNAAARAIVNNTGMASGPQVERNIDRIPPTSREDNKLVPWKVWDVTDSMMVSNSPAMKFYQPPMVVDKLMNVYTAFSKIADEHSGVPAYAHGDPQVGGAGNTASGLSMLMSSAARGIKALINTIDRNVTEPSVNKTYQFVVDEKENFGLICDYEVVTLGSTAALVKEQLSTRRMEFMQTTANPIDMQILGAEGRKYLLEETARSMHLDVGRLFPSGPNAPPSQQPPPAAALPTEGQPGAVPGQPGLGEPTTDPRTLDVAGNNPVGMDVRGPSNAAPGR